MTDLSIVVPGYNEGAVVKKVLQDIKYQLKSLGYNNKNCELVFVDDGSTDNTYSEVEKVKGVTIIKHERNLGYGSSLKTGIRAARFENIIILDADGQHNPKYIPEMLELGKSSDMVVGLRKGVKHSQLVRLPGKMLMSALTSSLAHRKIPDLNCGYRLVKKSIITQFIDLLCDGFSFSTTTTIAFICGGYNLSYLEVECNKREHGKSYVTFYAGFRTLLYILQIFMAFKPLRLFLPASSFFLVAGLGSLFHDVILYNNIGDTTVLLLITTSIIFLSGLIADQIASLRQQFLKMNAKK